MSTIKVNNIEPSSAGNETYFLAKAWVNFNGTGTISIRASGNISSITDGGTAIVDVNYTNSMQDANYSAVFGSIGFTNHPQAVASIRLGTTPTTSSISTTSGNTGGSGSAGQSAELSYVNVLINR